jgi:hypothetical protein
MATTFFGDLGGNFYALRSKLCQGIRFLRPEPPSGMLITPIRRCSGSRMPSIRSTCRRSFSAML